MSMLSVLWGIFLSALPLSEHGRKMKKESEYHESQSLNFFHFKELIISSAVQGTVLHIYPEVKGKDL